MTYQRPTVTEIGKAQHLIQGAGIDNSDPDKMSWNIICFPGGDLMRTASGGPSSSSVLESMLSLLRVLFG
jgi:hypothetical protein